PRSGRPLRLRNRALQLRRRPDGLSHRRGAVGAALRRAEAQDARRARRPGEARHRRRTLASLLMLELEVVEGDITALDAAATANAANDRLWMGAGVAGASRGAGGGGRERGGAEGGA